MLLHTEILGDGEPIVFLHTGLQTGLTDFAYQSDYFRHHFKVILPDLRGHGKSIENDISNFFEDSAMDLEETLNKLELKSVHLVGCSLGALVGLCFAKKFPHKVKSLTISGVLCEKPDNWNEMHKKEVESQARLLQNKEAANYFDNIHNTDWRQFLHRAKDEHWYPFYVTKDLDGIGAPVLFIVGEGNTAETKGATLYPLLKKNVHVSIIPFASHLVHCEQPEIYTKILEVFFNKIENK
ncbi:alpha/beta hydrolase [Solibacillus sp. R5-41]|nr:alpha/beta hydrolase [Solibacillus sp. R5-41]